MMTVLKKRIMQWKVLEAISVQSPPTLGTTRIRFALMGLLDNFVASVSHRFGLGYDA